MAAIGDIIVTIRAEYEKLGRAAEQAGAAMEGLADAIVFDDAQYVDTDSAYRCVFSSSPPEQPGQAPPLESQPPESVPAVPYARPRRGIRL